jgi:hypothetical protein
MKRILLPLIMLLAATPCFAQQGTSSGFVVPDNGSSTPLVSAPTADTDVDVTAGTKGDKTLEAVVTIGETEVCTPLTPGQKVRVGVPAGATLTVRDILNEEGEGDSDNRSGTVTWAPA